ncbi:MAG: MSCRAMM family protein [Jiangellaceae bacterium]
MRRPGVGIVVGLLVAPFVLTGITTASAVTTAGWADWEPLTGTAGSFTTSMQLPAGGFPEASVTSDSRSGQVGVQSGASAWHGTSTPPGGKYGSSQNRPYLNLRPRADTPAAPSATTYTFASPTPSSGWAFVLGDIDADQVQISAKGPDGQPLTATELGFQGTFNYCEVPPRPSCTGTDVPTWDPATSTLVGNAGAIDTSGASGWFEPTVPISTLTFTFAQRSGFPVYQTWFASLARDITGTVTLADENGVPVDPVEPVAGVTLNLFAPNGELVATTTSAADGTYSFEGFTAANGYTVEVVQPPGMVIVGASEQNADLSTDDAVDVDFLVREIIPVPVSGAVTDDDGNPVPGAVVTVDGPGGTFTATTDSSGNYLVDQVPPGDYTITVEPPDGFSDVSLPPELVIEVPPDSEEPIVDQNFVLQTLPSLSGAVTAADSPVPNATVTITGPGGTQSTVTGPDGTYSFDGLEDGDYTVTVEPPAGYTVVGDDELDETVAGDDVENVDFALARPGALGGTVTDTDGNPVAGVEVVVNGPGGDVTLTTDDEGNYFTDGLEPGDYTATITVPDGTTLVGPPSQGATITAAGESILDLDFALQPDLEAGGTVTDTSGNPVPGAEVTITGSNGDPVATITTGDDGTWSVPLPPGQGYMAEVTPPDGYEVVGEPGITFDVTDEPVTGLDFQLRLVPTPPDPDDDGARPAPSLPDTGVEPGPTLALAGVLVALGLALMAAGRRSDGLA